MAIKISNKYSPRATAPDANYPEGSLKNETVAGANDGTPLDQAWGNDYEGFTAALLAAGSVPYSGNPDTLLASDRMTALSNIINIALQNKALQIWGGRYSEVLDITTGTSSGTYPLDLTTIPMINSVGDTVVTDLSNKSLIYYKVLLSNHVVDNVTGTSILQRDDANGEILAQSLTSIGFSIRNDHSDSFILDVRSSTETFYIQKTEQFDPATTKIYIVGWVD